MQVGARGFARVIRYSTAQRPGTSRCAGNALRRDPSASWARWKTWATGDLQKCVACSAAKPPPRRYAAPLHPLPPRRQQPLRPCCADHDAMQRRGAPLALALALALCGAALARPQCRLVVIGAGTPRTGSTHEMKVRNRFAHARGPRLWADTSGGPCRNSWLGSRYVRWAWARSLTTPATGSGRCTRRWTRRRPTSTWPAKRCVGGAAQRARSVRRTTRRRCGRAARAAPLSAPIAARAAYVGSMRRAAGATRRALGPQSAGRGRHTRRVGTGLDVPLRGVAGAVGIVDQRNHCAVQVAQV